MEHQKIRFKIKDRYKMNNLCYHNFSYFKVNCNKCCAFIKSKKRSGCLFGCGITIYLKEK